MVYKVLTLSGGVIAGDFEENFDSEFLNFCQQENDKVFELRKLSSVKNLKFQKAIFSQAVLNGNLVAFTLAEVLITLGIIGVVSAITMPTLMTNVQNRIKAKRVENIKQKLSKVTDKMAVQSGLTGYGDTMSFVQEMSKHMKLAKICDNNHISDCWPTKEVDLDKDGKMWEISKTKNAKTLKISKDIRDNWSDTVGIVTADGTPMILSYKKTCDFDVDKSGLVFDKGSAMSNSMGCLSGVFDWNGGKKPNKLGNDVTLLGVANGLGNTCAYEIDGVCLGTPFKPTFLTFAECNEELEKGNLKGIQGCSWTKNYWADVVKQCGGVENMPTKDDLAKLANHLYKGGTLDLSKSPFQGTAEPPFVVWAREEDLFSTRHFGFGMRFSDAGSYYSAYDTYYSGGIGICLGD